MQTDTSCRGLWQSMEAEKSEAMERARFAASLTRPGLFPPGGDLGGRYDSPYQSLGAQGVTMLSSTIMFELFPNDRPFALYEPDLDGSFFQDPRSQVVLDDLSAVLEHRTLRLMEESQLRAAMSQALQYFLVGGLMVVDFREERPRAHRMENVCLRRDARGNVLCLLVREGLPIEMAPENVDVASLYPQGASMQQSTPHLYTVVKRLGGGRYETWQEIAAPWANGFQASGGYAEVPKSRRTYKNWEANPFAVAGFEWQDCEHYPTSFIDRVLGDLLGFEGLTKANLESAWIASQQRYFVDATSGRTRREDIIGGNNGSVIPGHADDVSTMNQRDRSPDLSWSFQSQETLRRALSEQMLLYLSARRDGERVTATEDNSVQVALNRGLGVGYAQLAPFQTHIAQIYYQRLKKDNHGKDVVKLLEQLSGQPLSMRVTAGVEMLGRQESLQRMMLVLNAATQVFGPEAVASEVSIRRTITSFFTAAGLPRNKIQLSDEEKEEARQQELQATIAKEATAPLINTASAQNLAQPQ